jgi:predicted esterase
MLVGFHGYRESAQTHLERLTTIPAGERWLIVAVQGLHRFYMRGGDVVASWMTREDRELAIADNVDYVGRVLDAVRAEYPVRPPLVFVGFSQGTAMAFRAAARFPADGLVVIGADVPPDVAGGLSVPLPPTLYGRGTRDELYPGAKHEEDLHVLARLGARVQSCTFEGGHEWTPEFNAAVGKFLDALFA